MNKNEILLWHYIDNQLSSEDKVVVQERLATDKDFAVLYQDILLFDQEIKTSQLLENRKVDLVEKTIRRIEEKGIIKSRNSSINLTPVAIFVSILVLLSLLLKNAGLEGTKYDKSFTNYFTDSDIYLQATDWAMNIPISGSIIILMFSLPILLAIDKLVGTKQRVTFVF